MTDRDDLSLVFLWDRFESIQPTCVPRDDGVRGRGRLPGCVRQ